MLGLEGKADRLTCSRRDGDALRGLGGSKQYPAIQSFDDVLAEPPIRLAVNRYLNDFIRVQSDELKNAISTWGNDRLRRGIGDDGVGQGWRGWGWCRCLAVQFGDCGGTNTDQDNCIS